MKKMCSTLAGRKSRSGRIAFINWKCGQVECGHSGGKDKQEIKVYFTFACDRSDDPQSKIVFLSLGGPQTLVHILNNYSQYPKLMYTVIRCIRSLSVCQQNKAALTSLGCLPALYKEMCTAADDRVLLAILVALRNLSDAATNEDNLAPLVIRLLEIVRVADAAQTSCACGILSNLTCNNVRNKQTLCTNHGVESLVEAINRFPDVEEATEPALCAREERETVVSLTVDILAHAAATIREDPAAESDGVPIWGVVEGAVSALHQLASHPAVAAHLCEDPAFLTLIVEFLSRSDVSSEGYVLIYPGTSGLVVLYQVLKTNCLSVNCSAFIYQLSKTPEGARTVEEAGMNLLEDCCVTPILVEAMRSEHKSVATYASGVLKNLENDKPAPYRQIRHLCDEIQYDGSGAPDLSYPTKSAVLGL
ncbi:hypothetical protein COOONC_18818 [Cooperia oncophora]